MGGGREGVHWLNDGCESDWLQMDVCDCVGRRYGSKQNVCVGGTNGWVDANPKKLQVCVCVWWDEWMGGWWVGRWMGAILPRSQCTRASPRESASPWHCH